MRRHASFLAIALTLLSAACGPGTAPSPSGELGRIEGTALAGPTCPVLTDPPQSGCDERPVAGATIVIADAAGNRIATVQTGDDGSFQVDVAPGTYAVRPEPVDGLMGTAPPASVTVAPGRSATVTLSYDTGIR